MKSTDTVLGASRDKFLFTPGPLTTSRAVKAALARDLGSRDTEFLALTQSIRQRLLTAAGVSESEFTTVLLQGCGTYAVEAALTSTVPASGKLLIIDNGAYGSRMARIADVARVPARVLRYTENQAPPPRDIGAALDADPAITHIALVHCETTSGIFNPIAEIGALARSRGKTFIVDAMSTFAGVPIDLEACAIDYLVASANKCLEGVPGMAFVIARRSALAKTEGCARSLSFDLHAQWRDLETRGEFRFTPPTKILLGLEQALNELDAEGGVAARHARYTENHRVLLAGMKQLGFQTYLTEQQLGMIITSFRYLAHPRFEYKAFYERLRDKDFVIYSGKVTDAECFRVGNIGRLFPHDVRALVAAVRDTLIEMEILK